MARRLDVGATLIAFRLLAAIGWLPLVLAEHGPWALACVSLAFFVVSLAIGIESPVEMSYRQAVTPDRLRGRMNATIRSMNWGMVAVGAPLGGVFADQVSYRFALWIGLSGAVIQALVLAVSRTRGARTADELDPSTADLTRHGTEAPAGRARADQLAVAYGARAVVLVAGEPVGLGSGLNDVPAEGETVDDGRAEPQSRERSGLPGRTTRWRRSRRCSSPHARSAPETAAQRSGGRALYSPAH